jgi:hypothetical protein
VINCLTFTASVGDKLANGLAVASDDEDDEDDNDADKDDVSDDSVDDNESDCDCED